MRRTMLALVLAAVAIAPGVPSASAGFGTAPCTYPAGKPLPGTGATIHVPTDQPTIQAAVNAAQEGDTILIASGTYNEAVVVNTPGLRIRGDSRTGVVLHGGNTRNIGIEVRADRVVVENLTARNYRDHGVQWRGVTGYWGRYLTTFNMGAYGVFALGSRCGEFSHVYASGTGDSGVYVGQCFPCDAVVHHVESRENALGFSGTNAGGNLQLRDSIWADNGLGIVPNSLDSELEPPARGIIIGPNNLVENNNHLTAPAFGIQAYFYGGGIVLAGTQSAIVYGNIVKDHELAGILVGPIVDSNAYVSAGNIIWGNTVSTVHPDGVDLTQGASSGPNNCWAHNTFSSSAPLLLEEVWRCSPVAGTQVTPPGGDPRVEAHIARLVALGEAGLSPRQPGDWKTWPAPTCATRPSSCVNGPSGQITQWLPALGI